MSNNGFKLRKVKFPMYKPTCKECCSDKLTIPMILVRRGDLPALHKPSVCKRCGTEYTDE